MSTVLPVYVPECSHVDNTEQFYCLLHLTLHEEPGCSTLEVLARLAEVDDESVGAGVSLPHSLLVTDRHKVSLVLVGREGLTCLVATNSPVRVEASHTGPGGAGLHGLQ